MGAVLSEPKHPYAPIDLRLDDHPKYIDYGLGEMALIACGITYCNRNRTDGRIPKSWPIRRFGSEAQPYIDKLLEDRVWRKLPDGSYEIVGFLDYNRSKAEIEARSAVRAEAGKKGGLKSGEARKRLEAKDEANASVNGQANAEANGKQNEPIFTDTDTDTVTDMDMSDHDRVTGGDRDLPTTAPPTKRGARKRASVSAVVAGQIREVFEHWVACRKVKHPKSTDRVLDPSRSQHITDRLAEGFSVETLKLACEGVFLCAWNLGENEQNKEYTEIHNAIGDARKVEKFSELAMRILERDGKALVTNGHTPASEAGSGVRPVALKQIDLPMTAEDVKQA
jgi:hypothetical protein